MPKAHAALPSARLSINPYFTGPLLDEDATDREGVCNDFGTESMPIDSCGLGAVPAFRPDGGLRNGLGDH